MRRNRTHHPPVSLPRRTALAAVILGLASAALPLGARADGAVVVRSPDIAAYEVALEGLLGSLSPKPPVYDLLENGDLSADVIAKIEKQDPGCLVGIGSKAAAALRKQFPGKPLVFSMVLTPAKRGLNDSNTTGVRLEIPPSEQFRRYQQVIPKLQKVGVIYDEKRSRKLITDAEGAARELKLELNAVKVGGTAEVPAAFEELISQVDAVWLVPDATVVTAQTFKHMLLVSLRERKPLLVFSAAFVKAGALAGVAPDYRAVGESTGRLVRSILKGENPSDIPVQDPPSTILVNRRSAERLGLKIDPASVPGMNVVE
ncbi:MAG: ABC transporter substrate-binding protein [Deltaproteobacteria bacterium]|nr:ABC transporter substrate-binding protein [Deltaproteobacteria bacterium]